MSYFEWANKFEEEEKPLADFKRTPKPEDSKTVMEHLYPDLCEQYSERVKKQQQFLEDAMVTYRTSREARPPTDVDQAAEAYDVTRDDALDLLHFIRNIMGDEEYQRVVAKVFDTGNKPLKTVEIPAVYEITDEVRDAYLERGINLTKRSSGGTR
jgi:hypothetical protein